MKNKHRQANYGARGPLTKKPTEKWVFYYSNPNISLIF